MAASVYTVVVFVVYNINFETSCRKDALIPSKRHSHYLLLFIPPAVVLYELFLSNDALRYTATFS